MIIAQVLTSDEKISSAKLVGCALGLAGMVMLIGPAALGIADAPLWAKLAVVGAAVSYGFAAAFGKRFKGLSPRITATGQLTASSLIMLPFALIVDRPWTLPMPPMEVIAAILALALVSTAFAYILYFRILSAAGATSASLVTLLVPPLGHPARNTLSGRNPVAHRGDGSRPHCSGALVTGQQARHKTQVRRLGPSRVRGDAGMSENRMMSLSALIQGARFWQGQTRS